jgi:nucleotide-binding universal stress UspA family protein
MVKGPIIAGIDGSSQSLQAAGLAWKIAQAARVRLVLVFAVPQMPGPDTVVQHIDAADLTERLIRAVRQDLVQAKAGGVIPGSVIDSLVVRPGRPGDVLNQMADAYHARLIVVGGRLHGALARSLGASTAHHLARTAHCPVFVLGPSAPVPQRVLAALDLSSASRQTLATAAEHAHLLGAHLRVIHVAEPMRHGGTLPRMMDAAQVIERSRVELEKLLQKELPDHPRDDGVVRSGLPDEAIAEEAHDWHADAIVVGTHGKGWIDRMLIGSTTERLLNRLPASLLIVPITSRRHKRARPPDGRRATKRRRPAR